MSGLVSIIVPVCNVEPYLRQALDSAVGQTYRDIEVIVVDDGSPDGCPGICDGYAARDPRVRVIHQANAGASSARNAALDVARGDWIMFLDGDDLYEPDCVENAVAAMLENQADAVLFDFVRFLPDGDEGRMGAGVPAGIYTGEQMLLELCRGKIANNIWQLATAHELYEGVRFPAGEDAEDVAVLHQVLDAAGSVAVVHTTGLRYRIRPGSITSVASLDHTRYAMLQYIKRLEYVRPRGESYALPVERTTSHNSLKYAMRLCHLRPMGEVVELHGFLREKGVRRAKLSAKRTVLWWMLRHTPRLLWVATRVTDKLTGKRPASATPGT